MVTGEEHIREVMECNRYPNTLVVWTPVTFHDFSDVFFSCYHGHTLNDSLRPVKEAPFHRRKLSFRE